MVSTKYYLFAFMGLAFWGISANGKAKQGDPDKTDKRRIYEVVDDTLWLYPRYNDQVYTYGLLSYPYDWFDVIKYFNVRDYWFKADGLSNGNANLEISTDWEGSIPVPLDYFHFRLDPEIKARDPFWKRYRTVIDYALIRSDNINVGPFRVGRSKRELMKDLNICTSNKWNIIRVKHPKKSINECSAQNTWHQGPNMEDIWNRLTGDGLEVIVSGDTISEIILCPNQKSHYADPKDFKRIEIINTNSR